MRLDSLKWLSNFTDVLSTTIFIWIHLKSLGSSSSQKGDSMEDHSRQELLEEYFSSSGVGAPEGVEGFIWLKVWYHLLCYRYICIMFNEKQKQTFINSYQFRCRLKDENRGRNSSLSSVPRDSTTQHQKVRTLRKMGNLVVQKILYA